MKHFGIKLIGITAAAAVLTSAVFQTACRAESDCADSVQTSACAYSLYCANNGEFLCGKNDGERLPMASTTKIMTALLGIEAYESGLCDEVTMKEEWYSEGSSMYLADGETVSMKDLVGGMLMVSGNDAANAIACTVGSSAEGFADMMNERAKKLGLDDTHFVTPSGLDADGHYTTARDLAKLMAACMENETFARIEISPSVTVDFVSPVGKSQTYYNENKLLRTYEYCVAGKTGYTDLAGRTLVSCAERGGIRLIAVTLNDGDDWNDHEALFEYGFDKIKMTRPDGETAPPDIAVVGGEKELAELVCGDAPLLASGGEDAQFTKEYELPPFLYAPLKAGSKAGEVKYYTGGVYAGSADITVKEDIAASDAATSFLENIASWLRSGGRE